MKKDRLYKFPLLIVLITSGLLIGCSTAIPSSHASSEDGGQTPFRMATSIPKTTSTPTTTNTLTATTTPTATPQPTNTSTPTSTKTQTPTPTQTSTPTITPTATPVVVLPGFYIVGACASYPHLRYNITGEFCVLNVTVNRDRHLIVSVSWTLHNIPDKIKVWKHTDEGNKHMYLTDNLGNHYTHIAGGGSAYRVPSPQMANDKPELGWFEFPAPPPGAISFNFHDDDQDIIVANIDLETRIVLYEEFPLTSYPLVLEYSPEVWDSSTLEDGTPVLIHKELTDCTLQESLFTEPKGKLKNTIDIGGVTFEIYGYIDQTKGLGFREYLAIDGLDLAMQPYFIVTLPLSDSLRCALDMSDVLAKLEGMSP